MHRCIELGRSKDGPESSLFDLKICDPDMPPSTTLPCLGITCSTDWPLSPPVSSSFLFVTTLSCGIKCMHLVQELSDSFFKVPKSFQITCILWSDSRCLRSAGWQRDNESGYLVQIPPLPPITSLILSKSIIQGDPQLSLL